MSDNQLSKRNGSAMLAVLFVIAIIAGLGTAYLAITTGQQRMVKSSIEDMEYNQAVVSGFEVSKAFLLAKYTASTSGWDNELSASIANYSTYTPEASSIIPPSPYTNYQSWFKWCRNIDYHGNTYFVRLENNNDGGSATNDTDSILKLTIEAWGIGNNPQQRSQEIVLNAMVTYKTDPYKPTSAVVVGGSLQISGNAAINGTNGSVQANGPVTLTGSATVAGDVTSTGSISAPPGSIGGSSNPNSEETSIPPINPADYSYLATHIFKTDGKVYDSLGSDIAIPAGWSYSVPPPGGISSAALGVWTKTGNDSATSGVFFFENSAVDISGSPGSAASPWPVTMIASGYIDVSGTPSLKPDPDGGGIALMSGEDLKMRGGAGNLYDVGLYAAHEQISLKGTPTINGVVLAEDYADNCSLISSTSEVDVDISGNTEITYNGDLTTVLIDGNPYIKVLGLKKSIKARN